MHSNIQLGKTAQPRDEAGKFSTSEYGSKTTRSMRISDAGWELLGEKAAANGVTRTDLIEQFVRGGNQQEIILKAIEAFIQLRADEYGKNGAQKGKEFSTATRDWSVFNRFVDLIKNSPWELGIDTND